MAEYLRNHQFPTKENAQQWLEHFFGLSAESSSSWNRQAEKNMRKWKIVKRPFYSVQEMAKEGITMNTRTPTDDESGYSFYHYWAILKL